MEIKEKGFLYRNLELENNKYISVVLEGYEDCKNYRWIIKKLLLEK